jgi:hypothetical protein
LDAVLVVKEIVPGEAMLVVAAGVGRYLEMGGLVSSVLGRRVLGMVAFVSVAQWRIHHAAKLLFVSHTTRCTS